MSAQPSSPYYTGDGGRGMSLVVRELEPRGIAEEQKNLLIVIVNELATNLSKYSAIEVQNYFAMMRVAEGLENSGYEEDPDFIRFGEFASVDYTTRGDITQTSSGFTLQIQVLENKERGLTIASYSSSVTLAELESLTGVRKASLDILTQMGVTLTATARSELTEAATENRVTAQTALAQGITAQRQGTEVAALSYYFQAAAYDPSIAEAVNRSSILNADISSGNIGNDVRNDIQWRRDWVARLTETEQFFDSFNRTESMPYTLFYTTEINQGTINYQNETVNLSIETHLHGSDIWTVSIERALQAVYDGLDATGRKNTWELASWPWRGVTSLNAFARRTQNFSVVFELLNNQGRVIGRQTLQSGGYWELNSSSGRPTVNVNADVRRTLNFQNVNANDITDRMTIQVATVNGIAAETAARNWVLQIRASNKDEFDRNDRFNFSRGVIQGFAGYSARVADLVIPETIWGDPVIWIGQEAFRNTGLTSVTIPNSVTSIGNEAFQNNQLTNIIIGNNVTSIDAGAFRDNRLTNVTIPDSVRSIGEAAFYPQTRYVGGDVVRSGVTSIIIGANVSMVRDPFGMYRGDNEGIIYVSNSFRDYYDNNDRKAGTYTIINTGWFYGEPEEVAKKNKTWNIWSGILIGVATIASLFIVVPYFQGKLTP
jgi:hypothetical protein